VSPGRRRQRREKVGVRWTRTCGCQVDFEKDEGLKCKTTAMYLPTYGRIAILLVEIWYYVNSPILMELLRMFHAVQNNIIIIK
jgi:hypothetical protein